jgi:hypothetical protein
MTPITIQQTSEQAKLAFDLHTHAEIESVRLLKSRVASRSLFEPLRGTIALTLKHNARQAPAPKGLLRLEISFHIRGAEESGSPAADYGKVRAPLVLIECTWEVDYRLAEGYEPPSEAVKAFKDGNAVFNCWPYFREYVQNTVTRMNLPPLTVPLLRLMPKWPKGKGGQPRPPQPGERAAEE